MNIQIVDLSLSGYSEKEYLDFLLKFHKNDAVYRCYNRGIWYKMTLGYIIIIAVIDGKIVGQASAYKTTVIIKGKKENLWWGVDTYVLSEYRGKGIGKKLQLYLHEHYPNFSSIWYSPTNGIVKKKCGANELFKVQFNYFPVSKFLGVILELAIQKIFHKKIIIHSRIPFVYFYFNKLFKKSCKYSEIAFNEVDFNFIKKSLRQFDFYVERSYDYMYWKYVLNPSLRYIILKVEKGNGMAYVFCTIAHEFTYVATKIVGVKILDIFTQENGINMSDVILTVIAYFKSKHILIDGIMSLENLLYWPKFVYPYPGTAFLSTIKADNISSPYVAYSDQDMEQMYINTLKK